MAVRDAPDEHYFGTFFLIRLHAWSDWKDPDSILSYRELTLTWPRWSKNRRQDKLTNSQMAITPCVPSPMNFKNSIAHIHVWHVSLEHPWFPHHSLLLASAGDTSSLTSTSRLDLNPARALGSRAGQGDWQVRRSGDNSHAWPTSPSRPVLRKRRLTKQGGHVTAPPSAPVGWCIHIRGWARNGPSVHHPCHFGQKCKPISDIQMRTKNIPSEICLFSKSWVNIRRRTWSDRTEWKWLEQQTELEQTY